MKGYGMVLSKDKIETYIPKNKPKLVILGTMASIAARDVDRRQRHSDAFFYHSKNNHFWTILQLVFEPKKKPKRFSNSEEKKQFLDKWQIAIANIINEIRIDEEISKDPSDSIIHDAFVGGYLKFKKINENFKRILEATPLFFTCSSNKKIINLINGYLSFNKLGVDTQRDVNFLMTPTRCNPLERSLGWKIRLARAGVLTESVQIP